MKHIILSSSLILFLDLLFSCTSDTLEEFTEDDQMVDDTTEQCLDTLRYQVEIKPIFDHKCATSGCHGDLELPLLNSYAELVPWLENDNSIKERIFNTPFDPMPPAGSLELTTEEKEQLKCWFDQGYPE